MQSCECEQVVLTDGSVEFVSEVLQAPALDLSATDFDATPTVIEVIERGRQGPPGESISISADEPNAIKRGKDGRMLVDNVMSTLSPTDFSLLYQLAK